jgi:thiol-disulfide isomerase/thioredoxin
MRRARFSDAACALAIVVLAGSAIGLGRAAARHVAPDEARHISSLLDDLETPSRLPNIALVRDDGTPATLWDLLKASRTVVSFYAPWCAPCQEELPELVRQTAGKDPQPMIVVVGSDEDPADVRKQFANLGLNEQHYFVDASGELERAARVTALPTTYLVRRMGRVEQRLVGFSQFRFQMLVMRAVSDTPSLYDNDN